jgi:chorismate mutase
MELHVPVSALKALRRALWAWKDQNPLPRVDPAREAAIYCRLLEQAEALGLSRQATARVLAAIVGRDFRA